jgi:hypothetical protein
MNGICGDDFKRRVATHFPLAILIRGMNPTATIGHRYAISFAPYREMKNSALANRSGG